MPGIHSFYVQCLLHTLESLTGAGEGRRVIRGMNGSPFPPSSEAEIVGVFRSPLGNLPSIFSHIAGHTKSLYSVISCGMARHHRGNPVARLRFEASYSAPKLFS